MYHRNSPSPTTPVYSPQTAHLSPQLSTSPNGSLLAQQGRRLSHNSAERRANHNATERLRRENLNSRFHELAMALPALRDNKKPSKSQIVCSSLDYIQQLTNKVLKRDEVLQQLFEENVVLLEALNQMRQQLGNEPLPPSQAQHNLQKMMHEEEEEEKLEAQQRQQQQLQSGGRSSTPAALTMSQPTPPLTPLPASRKASELNRIAIPAGSPRIVNTVAFSPASSTASYHPQSFQAPLQVQIPIQQQPNYTSQLSGWLSQSSAAALNDQQFALAHSCPSQLGNGFTDVDRNNHSAMLKQSGFSIPLDVDVNPGVNSADLLDQAFLMDEDFESVAQFDNLHVTPVTPVDVSEQAIIEDLIYLE